MGCSIQYLGKAFGERHQVWELGGLILTQFVGSDEHVSSPTLRLAVFRV